jgi:hypothetical protein
VLTVFFTPKESAQANLLPQGASFTAASFADNLIMPLANRHTQQPGDVARRRFHLHFDNSKCHTARHAQEEFATHWCARVPHSQYSPDLAIADFQLFERINR